MYELIAFLGEGEPEEEHLELVSTRYADTHWGIQGNTDFGQYIENYATERDIGVVRYFPDYKNYPPQDAPNERDLELMDDASLVVISYIDEIPSHVFRAISEQSIPTLVISTT